MLSDIKDLIFFINNYKQLTLLYNIFCIIYLQNLIVITKVLEALHVLIVLERQNLLEIG